MGVDSTEKNGSVAITCPPGFQLVCGAVEKFNRPFQVMQHVGERNHIEAPVFDRIQLVDFVAIKHKIEIVQIEHVTCNDV